MRWKALLIGTARLCWRLSAWLDPFGNSLFVRSLRAARARWRWRKLFLVRPDFDCFGGDQNR